MFQNYLKIALRNLWKYRFYTGINVLGLATGMLCFLFLFAFIQDERSFDRFHSKVDRIYRMNFEGKIGGNELVVAQVGAPVGAALQAEFPEVETFARLRAQGDFLVTFGNQSYYETGVIYADSTLLEVFDFELLSGQVNQVLRRPNTAIISKSLARKYFGQQDPVGESLRLDNEQDVVIEGVMADIPKNSHLQSDLFLSMSGLEESRSPLWTNMNFYTYFVLREHAQIDGLAAKLPDFLRRNVGAELEQFMQISFEDFLAAGNEGAYTVSALPNIYFEPQYASDINPTSDRSYLFIFAAAGFFILLLAAVNFINLATARASIRAQEVGVRKVVGALPKQLIGQFLSESTSLAFLALLVSLVGMRILLPAFNTFTDKTFTASDIWATPGIGICCLALVLGIGLLAGGYPSFILSRFAPLRNMGQKVGNNKSYFRNGLVVFQFVVTALLLIGTFTVYQQMQYIQNKNLGFNKEQLLLLEGVYGLEEKVDILAEKVTALPQVEHATLTSFLPTPSNRNSTGYFKGNNPQGQMTLLQAWRVDENFLPTLDIQLTQGRNFAPSKTEEVSLDVIVNKATLLAFDIEGDPLGQQISSNFGNQPEAGVAPDLTTYNIIGVVEDFHFASLHEEIKPLVLHQGRSNYYLAMRVKNTDIGPLLTSLEREWESLSPALPFAYSFLDDNFTRMHLSEIRMGRIASLFAGLSMLIACIGLLGLATFSALQRQKEVSIRKILGASVGSLFLLLTKDFGKLILLAFFIAAPIAYYLMQTWLQRFAYAQPVSWTVIMSTALLLLVVGLVAVSYQSIRAAFVSPASTLRKDG